MTPIDSTRYVLEGYLPAGNAINPYSTPSLAANGWRIGCWLARLNWPKPTRALLTKHDITLVYFPGKPLPRRIVWRDNAPAWL